MHPSFSPRERITVAAHRGAQIALQCQHPPHGDPLACVIYVHGSTFGADLSVYHAFDGRSWADALADSGFAVWGFDFVGYGASSRYPLDLKRPPGDWRDALNDLRAVVGAVRDRNGGRPIALLAHSRGGAVAARFAGDFAEDVAALVLFAPVAPRAGAAAEPLAAPAPLPSHQPLSTWTQYRRFIEDVPRGQAQVLSEAHMQRWGEAFLASDPTSATRSPPSVMTPCGPLADLATLWSGHAWYDPARIVAPTLLVRGEWDSMCNDDDAVLLMSQMGATLRRDLKIARATHLMHLEQQRGELHTQVNRFLLQVLR